MKRAAVKAMRACGHLAMHQLEQRLMHAQPSDHPTIFIIGAPRSGTSLLYELMVMRMRFAYLSNAAHRFPQTPLAASYLCKHAIERWRGNFTSRYGHISGWGAPNEGGAVWLRWLAEDGWSESQHLDREHAKALRCLTAGLSKILEAPFLNKNVMHSVRIRLINQVWPDALFIEVRRGTLDNARSIVRAQRAQKSYEEWWSVRPKLSQSYLGASDTVRAIAQVVGCASDIEEDCSAIGEARLHRVHYAKLCANPRDTLDQLGAFLKKNGAAISIRGDVPERFPISPSAVLSMQDEFAMHDTLERLTHHAQKIAI